jgi:hypothetical protein
LRKISRCACARGRAYTIAYAIILGSPKFSKVSLLLNLLCAGTIVLPFEKFLLVHVARDHTCIFKYASTLGSPNFSKVSSLLNLLCTGTIVLTFEKFLQVRVCTRSRVYNRMLIHTGQPNLTPQHLDADFDSCHGSYE